MDLTPEQQQAEIAVAIAAYAGVTVSLACVDTTDVGEAGWQVLNAFQELNSAVELSIAGAGTAAALTTATANLDFGTTDPVITFARAGKYLLIANLNVQYTGATYAALQSATFTIRRTNNTPANIGTARSVLLPIATTTTLLVGNATVVFVYTAVAGDSLTIQGTLSANPSAGSVSVPNATLVATPVH